MTLRVLEEGDDADDANNQIIEGADQEN